MATLSGADSTTRLRRPRRRGSAEAAAGAAPLPQGRRRSTPDLDSLYIVTAADPFEELGVSPGSPALLAGRRSSDPHFVDELQMSAPLAGFVGLGLAEEEFSYDAMPSDWT